MGFKLFPSLITGLRRNKPPGQLDPGSNQLAKADGPRQLWVAPDPIEALQAALAIGLAIFEMADAVLT